MMTYSPLRAEINNMTGEERHIVESIIERSAKIREDIERVRKQNLISDNDAYDGLLEFYDGLCDAEAKLERVLED